MFVERITQGIMDDRSDNGDIPRENFVAGLKQSVRLLKAGRAAKVLLAYNADSRIAEEISAVCREKGIVPDASKSMAEIGLLCGIEVGCAVCVLKKDGSVPE